MQKKPSTSSGSKKLIKSGNNNLFQIIDYMKKHKVTYVKCEGIEVKIDRFEETETKTNHKIDPLTGESEDVLFRSAR